MATSISNTRIRKRKGHCVQWKRDKMAASIGQWTIYYGQMKGEWSVNEHAGFRHIVRSVLLAKTIPILQCFWRKNVHTDQAARATRGGRYGAHGTHTSLSRFAVKCRCVLVSHSPEWGWVQFNASGHMTVVKVPLFMPNQDNCFKNQFLKYSFAKSSTVAEVHESLFP